MKAAFVVTSVAAEDDIEGIVRHIATDSTQSAQRFGLEFKEALLRIRDFPQMGRAIAGKRGFRMTRVSARFHRYLIIYKLDNGGVEIQRVLHGAMDIPAQLSKPKR